jgi:DNA-binding transcriptional MocR family regulator
MRLNFSYSTEEQIDEGISRLAKMIRENMQTCKLAATVVY